MSENPAKTRFEEAVEAPTGPCCVTVLGAGGTGLAYIAASTLGGRVGALRMSVLTYLIPVVAAAPTTAEQGITLPESDILTQMPSESPETRCKVYR